MSQASSSGEHVAPHEKPLAPSDYVVEINDYRADRLHEAIRSDPSLDDDEDSACQLDKQLHRDRRRSSLQILDLKLIHSLANANNNESNGPINGPEGVCEFEELPQF